MLILCWNVAGLTTTVQRIQQLMQQSNSSSSNKRPAQLLHDYWSNHHKADMICLQEQKIPRAQLDSNLHTSIINIPGYESFWSSADKGINGVVTYVRTGMTIRANAHILSSPELNKQGRCIVTYHEKFVLYNVYVPAGPVSPNKMAFLNALRQAMQSEEKPVILVGDLNISLSKLDIYWEYRSVKIDTVVSQQEQEQQDNECNNPAINNSLDPNLWKTQLVSSWPIILKSLETLQPVPIQTTNPATGKKYNKYRAQIVDKDGRKAFLGRVRDTPDDCICSYDIQAREYTDPETDTSILVAEANTLSIAALTELMQKVVKVDWSEKVQKHIANTTYADVNQLAPPRQWLQSVLESGNMVDAFRHYHPHAQGRFTCWNQSENKRYSNQGSRIDMTLVDAALMPYLFPTTLSLHCDGTNCRLDPYSEIAAFYAATAGGRYQPVGFEGGGIAEASVETYMSQFCEPHTGIVYTPPSYSDHVAISLHLQDLILGSNTIQLQSDAATKKAQPHKRQQSIAAFCVRGDAAVALKKTTAVAINKKPVKAGTSKKIKNTIMQNFVKKK